MLAKEKGRRGVQPAVRPEFSIIQSISVVKVVYMPSRIFASCEATSTNNQVRYGSTDFRT